MRILLFTIMLFFSLQSKQVRAGDFGLGLSLGSMTGITGEYKLDGKSFIDGYIGQGLSNGWMHMAFDYMLRNKNAFYIQAYNMDFNYGLGVKMKNDKNDSNIGPRINSEIAHTIDNFPLKLFFAAAGNFYLFNGAGVDIDLSIGARYFF